MNLIAWELIVGIHQLHNFSDSYCWFWSFVNLPFDSDFDLHSHLGFDVDVEVAVKIGFERDFDRDCHWPNENEIFQGSKVSAESIPN
jgi:hypothetical protein